MASSAAIPIINPTAEAIKIKVKTGSMDLTEAVEAARKRYVERNPQSLKLFEEAVKCLPGGNTRHVLFTAPFPVYLQRGEGHQVFSEDGQVYVSNLRLHCEKVEVSENVISPTYAQPNNLPLASPTS